MDFLRRCISTLGFFVHKLFGSADKQKKQDALAIIGGWLNGG